MGYVNKIVNLFLKKQKNSIFDDMKTKKTDKKPLNSANSSNPFAKMIDDKKRIQEAITKNIPLSSLNGIKFVKPI